MRLCLIGMIVALLLSEAANAQQTNISKGDFDQVNEIITNLYGIPHYDVTCVFSKTKDGGGLIDRRAYNKSFRDQEYSKIYGPIFSKSLFNLIKPLCVNDKQFSGMPDFRMQDKDIDSDPSFSDGVYLKIIRPITILHASENMIRARVDWSESAKGTKSPFSNGRTDLIFVNENGRWLINDAATLKSSPGVADFSIEDFDSFFLTTHLR